MTGTQSTTDAALALLARKSPGSGEAPRLGAKSMLRVGVAAFVAASACLAWYLLSRESARLEERDEV